MPHDPACQIGRQDKRPGLRGTCPPVIGNCQLDRATAADGHADKPQVIAQLAADLIKTALLAPCVVKDAVVIKVQGGKVKLCAFAQDRLAVISRLGRADVAGFRRVKAAAGGCHHGIPQAFAFLGVPEECAAIAIRGQKAIVVKAHSCVGRLPGCDVARIAPLHRQRLGDNGIDRIADLELVDGRVEPVGGGMRLSPFADETALHGHDGIGIRRDHRAKLLDVVQHDRQRRILARLSVGDRVVVGHAQDHFQAIFPGKRKACFQRGQHGRRQRLVAIVIQSDHSQHHAQATAGTFCELGVCDCQKASAARELPPTTLGVGKFRLGSGEAIGGVGQHRGGQRNNGGKKNGKYPKHSRLPVKILSYQR